MLSSRYSNIMDCHTQYHHHTKPFKTFHSMVARSRSPIFTITVAMLRLPIVIILSLSVATTYGFIVTTTTTTTTTWTTKLSSRRLPTAKTKDNTDFCCSNYSSSLRRYGHNRNRNNNPEIIRLRAAEKDPEQTGSEILRAEAESLKAKADKLRSEIEENASSLPTKNSSTGKENNNADVGTSTAVAAATTPPITLPWDIVSTGPKGEGDREFRLYCDIGKEEGTWMDPRWGASGKRIEFSLDVGLLTNRLAAPEMSKKMIQDNTVGKSSQVFALDTAKFARLRDGFDRMECKGGAYRIDTGRSGRSTIRIVIEVEGTVKADQAYVYGDVSIPAGCLYFSLPAFGSGINNLSIKEGMVSVRQVGWHTGWRREESRILGVFKAKPLSEAKKKDRF